MIKKVGMLGGGMVGLGLIVGGCSAAPPQGGASAELQQSRQDFVDSVNGLRSINGLSSKNGLRSINGLSSRNGLASRNGLRSINGLDDTNGMNSINGLASRNGLAIDVSGLPVNCAGGLVAGVSCTGLPDGLLSNTTGLMANDAGEIVVPYLVRCALPAGQSIAVQDYTGAVVNFNGEIGLTPQWATSGFIDANGMEIISACLEAFTNGLGNHVQLELDSTQYSALGPHGTSNNPYKYQEGAFWGNLFVTPPTTAYCTGKDYTGILNIGGVSLTATQARACSGYSDCPYANAGNCESQLLFLTLGNGACTWDSGMVNAKTCKSGNVTWNNPIYTYRLDVGTQ